MTVPDPDKLRLRAVEHAAGVYDEEDQDHHDQPDTLDREER